MAERVEYGGIDWSATQPDRDEPEIVNTVLLLSLPTPSPDWRDSFIKHTETMESLTKPLSLKAHRVYVQCEVDVLESVIEDIRQRIDEANKVMEEREREEELTRLAEQTAAAQTAEAYKQTEAKLEEIRKRMYASK